MWHQVRFGSSERKIDFKSAVSRVISTSLKEKNQECVGKTRERERERVASRACWQFEEKVDRVASRAYWKVQDKAKGTASGA